jgi:alpha-L-fucosidase
MNMAVRWRLCLFAVVAGTCGVPAHSAEPAVVEKQRGDGITELRVVSDAGKELAAYTVDLQRHRAPTTSRDDPSIRRWESYRFGGFVCYNDNQFSGSELSQNQDAKLYGPTALNVKGWAAAMEQAGMKYAVLTTRHTSGFLLWDSATSDFDVASSSNTTDVVGEFVKECRRYGIAPGFYYCLWGGKGWMPHPNARAIVLAQLAELASRYGEIPYFWIDMKHWGPDNLSAQEIYDAIKNQQPGAVVIFNQHIQDGRKINYFPTDAINGEVHLPPAGGHEPFREVGGKRYYLPFEFEPVSQRIPSGTTTPAGPVGAWFTYGEGRGFPASQPFPARFLGHWIRSAYARGAANVLLSLAPDHTGGMRPQDVRQLEELGNLLHEWEARKAAVIPVADVTASGTWPEPAYAASAACDGDPGTRWGGAPQTTNGWLELDLGREATFRQAWISEGWDRTRRFELQIKEGDAWRTFHSGTTLGDDYSARFDPVTGRYVRLLIPEATDVPTIWEIQLFRE